MTSGPVVNLIAGAGVSVTPDEGEDTYRIDATPKNFTQVQSTSNVSVNSGSPLTQIPGLILPLTIISPSSSYLITLTLDTQCNEETGPMALVVVMRRDGISTDQLIVAANWPAALRLPLLGNRSLTAPPQSLTLDFAIYIANLGGTSATYTILQGSTATLQQIT